MELIFFGLFFVLFLVIVGAALSRVLIRFKDVLGFIPPALWFLGAVGLFVRSLINDDAMSAFEFSVFGALLLSMILNLFYVLYIFKHFEAE